MLIIPEQAKRTYLIVFLAVFVFNLFLQIVVKILEPDRAVIIDGVRYVVDIAENVALLGFNPVLHHNLPV